MSSAVGYTLPLWQLLNQCRFECDQRLWCQSFELNSINKTCVLSDAGADVAAKRTESAGTLLFVRISAAAGVGQMLPGFAPPGLAELPPETNPTVNGN